MAIDVRTTEWSDLHMVVLGTIRHHAIADAKDVAGWLRLPVPLVEALCAELEAGVNRAMRAAPG
jgi:hypothetical protein